MAPQLYRDRVWPLPPNRVWRSYHGGRTLDEIAGARNPQDSHFPEDWIASTTAAVNPGRNDPRTGLGTVQMDGETVWLTSLIAADPEYALGSQHLARHGQRVVPLVKFLDSAVRLHFQCHPTIPFAQQHFHSNWGKAEAYHILQVRPEVSDPYIYLGLQHPPSREEMRRLIVEQDIAGLEACFDRISVRPGETYFVPGGLPHAIGPGVLMVEVMEPTDFVSRFEWEKCGYTLPEQARFMGRDVDFGLDMLDFTVVQVEEVRNHYQPVPAILSLGRQLLLGPPLTNSFSIEKLSLETTLVIEDQTYSINIVVSGRVRIRSGNAVQEFHQWDKFFVPAALGGLEYSGEHAEILRCLPPR